MNFKVTQTGCTGPQFGQNWGQIQKSGSTNRQEKKRGQNCFSQLNWSSHEFQPQFPICLTCDVAHILC